MLRYSQNASYEHFKTTFVFSERIPWTKEEKEAVVRHFAAHITEKICPNKSEVDKCLAQEGALRSRTWKAVKDYCRTRFNAKNPLFTQ